MTGLRQGEKGWQSRVKELEKGGEDEWESGEKRLRGMRQQQNGECKGRYAERAVNDE